MSGRLNISSIFSIIFLIFHPANNNNKKLRLLTPPSGMNWRQGDQIGRIFNIWLLFTWVFLTFYPSKQFQNIVWCTYFNIQKQFDATIFDYQFELL